MCKVAAVLLNARHGVVNIIIIETIIAILFFSVHTASNNDPTALAGMNWRLPEQTNAQACPVTCSTCPATLKGSVSVDSVDITHSVALYDAVMLYAHAGNTMPIVCR